jgi:hypothetical protein
VNWIDYVAVGAAISPLVIVGYAYAGYPATLWLIRAVRGARRVVSPEEVRDWPEVTLTVPCYNEAGSIAVMLDRLLALDYPAERRHILVLSDASTDGTDDIVRGYADRGVQLLRLPERKGKSAAENAAHAKLQGTIAVNVDATVVLGPSSLKSLIAAFEDPTVGVASGRDVSIAAAQREQSGGEAGYVGYEMFVRGLETAVDGIVGASGCFFGIRRHLYPSDFPEHLSRDFGSPLIARAHGFRSVSVEAAVCGVPRAKSLEQEYPRKVRTMARGLQTLWYQRALLNPFRFGWFAWMLASHKLARWLPYPTIIIAMVGWIVLGVRQPIATPIMLFGATVVALGLLGWRWPSTRTPPRWLAMMGFMVAAGTAGLSAWQRALTGTRAAVWEPTRRSA